MKQRRFSKPLDARKSPRGSFVMTVGMERCLEAVAESSGLSVAEVLRRFTAYGIVAESPRALAELSGRARGEIETLAGLVGKDSTP